jgi:amidase
MSSLLPSAWRSLISAEGVCPLALVIAFAMIVKSGWLKHGNGYFIKRARPLAHSDLKSPSAPGQHMEQSDHSIPQCTGVISTNRLIMALKAAILLTLLSFSTLGLSTASRAFRGDASCYPDLLEVGAEELVAGLESGAWTSVDLTKAYILRIKETNSVLCAVTEINPDALSIAAALDAERANGTIRSVLHGIPMLIKNNIATDDQMNNTAGSYSLLGAKAPRDATVASKLRAAGVILLGKSNLSQWANFRSSNSSNGWSAHGGQVTGAYYPNMDPSGSSSGSGVGVSIGLAFAALGTETDGSIVSPSSANNLVGIKPTVGLTSRSLVIPISEHQDTVG